MRSLGLALFVLLLPSLALAAPREEVRELEGRNAIDVPVTIVLGAGWIGSELAKKKLAPSACRWCDSVPAIDDYSRDHLRWEHPAKADSLSNALDFAGMPLLMFGADALLASQHGVLNKSPQDGLWILEAVVAASAMNQAIKFSVGRERPFVHALPADQKGLTAQPSDNDLSFYSGHTTLAFTLVAATATVATLRNYRNAWVVWPVGLAAAFGVGYLRIAADKHWLTDVATGALLGSATGVGVPLLLHGRKADSMTAGASPLGGPHVVLAFRF